MRSGFELVSTIYQSGETTIWRARSEDDQSLKILKIIGTGVSSTDAHARLQHEYKLVRKIEHDNVILSHGIVDLGNSVALVMEDFGGVSLTDQVNAKTLDISSILLIALGAAKALSAVHKGGVIHKDISPENLLFNAETGQLKLIDFGISSEVPLESLQLESASNLEGTLEFLAPEQTGRIAWPLDYRADFYGLGATLYYCLASQPPFLANDPLELVHFHLSKKPVDLAEFDPKIPRSLAQVVAKLLAKSPDDRYQSAQGLIYDLVQCQQLWAKKDVTTAFEIGTKDINPTFKLPQTLFGREEELELLSAEVEKASKGACRVCLVTGDSGVGKSAIIGHAQNLIFSKRGLFFGGKYDQLQANRPFSALLYALSKLLQHISREPEGSKQKWRLRINEALGKQANVLLSVLPDLEGLIELDPMIEDLPPVEAQIRFNRAFLGLIRALCHADFPIILFLDDLQWADQASLNFLEEVLGDPSIKNLLVIGAYRQNEVGPEHYLSLILNRIKGKEDQSARVGRIHLGPLNIDAITEMLQATLMAKPEKAVALAAVLLGKTGGNPFFLHSFLTSLSQQKVIRFDFEESCWSWDLEQVRIKYASENVLQLLLDGFNQLPPETVQVMGWAAVLNNRFRLDSLAEVSGVSPSELRDRLLPAQQLGYIINLNAAYRYSGEEATKLGQAEYRFQHDQVQSAAMDLIEPEELKALHLKAARQLFNSTEGAKQDERLFDIVRYYNEGVEQITDRSEVDRVIELNRKAALRSIGVNAYDLALKSAALGFNLLGDQPWTANRELAFDLSFIQYQAYFLSSKPEEMDRLGDLLLIHSETVLEKARVLNLKILAAGTSSQNKKAADLVVEASSMLGLRWPKSYKLPTVVATLIKTKIALRQYNPDELDEMKPTEDPQDLMLHEIMLSSAGIIYQHDPNMFAIAMMIWTRVALERGFSPRCISGFGTFAIILMNTGSPKQAYAWSDLATRLTQRYPSDSVFAKTRFTLTAFIDPWRKPIRTLINEYHEVFPIALRSGDIQYGIFASNHICPNQLWAGVNLSEVNASNRMIRPFMKQVGFTDGVAFDKAFAQAARCLQGKTSSSLSYDDIGEDFNEEDFSKEVDDIEIVMVKLWYYIFKCYCLVFYGHYKEALRFGEFAEKNRAASDGLGFMTAIDIFYGIALLRAAETDQEKKLACKKAGKYVKKLHKWADGCEANYRAPAWLLEAELARAKGNREQAISLYQKAIGRAAGDSLIHFQALASELLGELYGANEEEVYLSHLYLKEAAGLYHRWGAQGKVLQLLERVPDLPRMDIGESQRSTTRSYDIKTTFGSTASNIGFLDFESLLKTTQALSEEINYQSLQSQLFNLVIENTGAQKAWLLLQHDGKWQVVAKHGQDEEVSLPMPLDVCVQMSKSVLNRMIQSGEPVVVVDAKVDSSLSHDDYVQKNKVCSILCQPLVLGQNLLGAIYLENNLITGCFTEDRLTVLKVIASQASISLENARLFEESKNTALKLEQYSQGLEEKVNERTAELLEANETKDKFFSIIAHDLKGPIGSLYVIFNEVLDASEPLEPALLGAIRSSTKSTYELLENLLTWARNQKGLITVNKEEINLHTLIQEGCQLLNVSTAAKGIVLQHEVQLDHLVIGDPSMINTVIRNLINNAIKFSNRDGKITVSAIEESGMAMILVADEGVGLSEAQMGTLFNDNVKVISTKGTQAEAGTGLGLVLCQDFVRQNGGTIGVRSTLGEGSQFWFTLNLGSPLSSQESGAKEMHQFNHLKTLLVEDNPLALEASGQVLKEISVPFDHAESGEAAVQLAGQTSYDVIWMDIDLAVMDGLQATELIRQNSASKGGRIIALTSYSEKELALKIEARPGLNPNCFDGYLIKPPDKREVLKVLARLLV